MEQSAEEIGDLYLDVGEAYLEKGAYLAALPLLSALIISEKYNLAVVWLRHAGSLASTFREVLRGGGHLPMTPHTDPKNPKTNILDFSPTRSGRTCHLWHQTGVEGQSGSGDVKAGREQSQIGKQLPYFSAL